MPKSKKPKPVLVSVRISQEFSVYLTMYAASELVGVSTAARRILCRFLFDHFKEQGLPANVEQTNLLIDYPKGRKK